MRPPHAVHFLRRGSTAEPGSALLPKNLLAVRGAQGRRHSALELEHEVSAPQLHHLQIKKPHHGAGGRRGSRMIEPPHVMIAEGDESEAAEASDRVSGNASSLPKPTIAINIEDEVHKL